jgi:cardiolipin synthase A/B
MSHPTESHIPSVPGGSYPLRPGNRVRPLIDGVHAFRRTCEAVEAARHSVWVVVAFIRPEFRLPDDRGSLGGINLNQRAMVSPGHAGGDGIHDAYVELTGPSATDVHHNFVQRWNEASDRNASDGLWAHTAGDSLAFPNRASSMQGTSTVQIQRNVHAARYRNGHPSPGAQPYAIADGESTIRRQYLAAITAARRSIYIENQALTDEPTVDALASAVVRGVETVVLTPAEPEGWVGDVRNRPDDRAFFDKFASLGRHENFTLAGIAGRNASGTRTDVYIHGKLMLVDDAWATIGSCNLHRNSLYGHSEINASIWDPDAVRALRCELLAEHLAQDTTHLDDSAALRLYREISIANRARRDKGDSNWQGLAYSLDPAIYGA